MTGCFPDFLTKFVSLLDLRERFIIYLHGVFMGRILNECGQIKVTFLL